MNDEQWRRNLRDAILSAEPSLSQTHMIVHMRWTKSFYEEVMTVPPPRPAPTGHPCIVKITREQYEAMKKLIIDEGGEKPFTATKSLALDGLTQMSYCFGATSSDYITLYPTIG